MSQLTTFSKTLIIIIAVGIFSLLAITCYNCTKSQQYHQPATSYQTPSPVQDYGTHQVIAQPGGSQVVVVKDQSGSEFFMDYLIFQTLMNAGGMNNVYGYYNQHRYDPTWDRDQGYYRSNSKTVINNYYGSQVDDSKPITDQVKQKEVEYKQSNGFKSKPNTGSQSNGFSGKWFNSNTPTSTPEPKYESSPGFKNPTTAPKYEKSNGFGSSTKRSSNSTNSGTNSKPSGGFKSSTSSSTGGNYKSSSGFKKKN